MHEVGAASLGAALRDGQAAVGCAPWRRPDPLIIKRGRRGVLNGFAARRDGWRLGVAPPGAGRTPHFPLGATRVGLSASQVNAVPILPR
jgi:hypothetical protein